MAYGTNKKKGTTKSKPKKGLIESYMDLPTSEKIMKAPGYIASAPIYYGIKFGEKVSQMKKDYEKGKKIREGTTKKQSAPTQKPAAKKAPVTKPAVKKAPAKK